MGITKLLNSKTLGKSTPLFIFRLLIPMCGEIQHINGKSWFSMESSCIIIHQPKRQKLHVPRLWTSVDQNKKQKKTDLGKPEHFQDLQKLFESYE